MKRLLEACDQGLLMLDIAAGSLDEAIQQMVDMLVRKGALAATDAPEVLSALREREKIAASAIGHSVAVPHSYLPCIAEPRIVIARLKHGINAGAPDGLPTRFVFLLVGPTDATSDHLDALANVARLMSDEEFRYLASMAKTPAVFRVAVASRSAEAVAEEAYEAPSDELKYSGRLGGGLMADIRRRLPHYVSDFTDGLHSKCVSSTIFLFFACMAPEIIFGGLMSALTDGAIGAVEMIVASAICGMIYALLGGQPLIILGGTGPMLIFTGILYSYCQEHQLEFLTTYAWVGIWAAVTLVILAITDASCLMRFFTRFTDELFAALISLIFIYEAINSLIDIYHRVPHAESLGYDVANLSLLLALGTFYIAISLSRFRQSNFLLPQVREFLADFGPTIAIASMAAIAHFAKEATQLEPLPAPNEFGTTSGRPWLVPWQDVSGWLIAATIAPGILCGLLVYLDQNITARLVNSPDNRLEKGSAYHLDLAVIGIMLGFCSLFGLPWIAAATVRSLNHVRSLATTEEKVDKSGSTHTHILHVRETRITGFTIHLFMGLSLLLLPLLQYIPLAVLYGLFLYMGVVSIKGNQFFERIGLFFTDPALYPSTHYVRRVSRKKLHLFTLIQFVCLVLLWVVKASEYGILFPLFIALLVPFRFALGYFFAEEDLAALDAEENPIEEEETWS